MCTSYLEESILEIVFPVVLDSSTIIDLYGTFWMNCTKASRVVLNENDSLGGFSRTESLSKTDTVQLLLCASIPILFAVLIRSHS